MTTDSQGVLVFGTGLVVLHLVRSEIYLWYLSTGMRIPLLLTGAVLVLLGVLTILRGLREEDADHESEPVASHHGGGHGGTRVSWLLVLPVFVVLVIVPPPLGSYAAEREPNWVPPSPRSAFPPLPAPVDGAVDITLADVITRDRFAGDETLSGVPLRLIGFVVLDPGIPDGFRLARFTLSCCAADAVVKQVEVRGGVAAQAPPSDTWVEVTATWVEPSNGPQEVRPMVELRAVSVVPIEPPANPYG